MTHKFPSLSKALARLAASNTPRKRNNALKAFAVAVKQLRDDVAKQYPRLRDDGTAIVPYKKRGAYCPHCKRPFKTFRQFARHVMEMINPPNRRVPECWCGGNFRNMEHLVRHLAGIEDLKTHYLPWAMIELTKELSR